MPGPGCDLGGRTWSGRYRLRPGLFGAVLEELVTMNDGEQRWLKPRFAVPFDKLCPNSTPNR